MFATSFSMGRIFKRYPGTAELFLAALENGKVHGMRYANFTEVFPESAMFDSADDGMCLLGYATKARNEARGYGTWRNWESIKETAGFTLAEAVVMPVRPGQTPKNSWRCRWLARITRNWLARRDLRTRFSLWLVNRHARSSSAVAAAAL